MGCFMHSQNNVPDIALFVNRMLYGSKCERTVRVAVAWSPNRR
jgi:hypothetical protein